MLGALILTLGAFLLLGGLTGTAWAVDETTSGPQGIAPLRTYPASEKGLERLLTDLTALDERNDAESRNKYLDSMMLPAGHAWFEKAFGQRFGPQLTREYGESRNLDRAFLSGILSALRGPKQKWNILRFERTCDPKADADTYPVLALRQESVTLYLVSGSTSSRPHGMQLGYFANVDGVFRFLGRIELQPWMWKSAEAAEIDGKEQQQKLLHQVPPSYPSKARSGFRTGKVRFAAVIEPGGTVAELGVLQGTCEFAQAAQEAVRQWRYSPTVIGGKPVWVVTTIEVTFTLH